MSVLWRKISNPGGFAGGVTRGRSEERSAAGNRKGKGRKAHSRVRDRRARRKRERKKKERERENDRNWKTAKSEKGEARQRRRRDEEKEADKAIRFNEQPSGMGEPPLRLSYPVSSLAPGESGR